MTYETRETLRHDLITDQLDKAEHGFEQILDGSHAADLHLLNALSICHDAHQATKLAEMLSKMHDVRCSMWSALGMSNSDTFRR